MAKPVNHAHDVAAPLNESLLAIALHIFAQGAKPNSGIQSLCNLKAIKHKCVIQAKRVKRAEDVPTC
jgi:hypothetical protein